MDVLLTDSDWESFSESGSSEQEDIEFFYRGQAQTLFSSLEDTIGKIDDFLSFERGFTLGDIVCSITDPSGQTGRVIDITMLADLENIQGQIIKEVDSKKLQKIRSISMGDYVILGPWLGRVEKVVDCVSVVFDDGSKCKVTAFDQEKLVPLSPNVLEDSQYSYYPGQRVQTKLSQAPRSTRWLCGNWRENLDEGTVSSVEAGLVYVQWVASALLEINSNLPAPSRLQDPKNLTLLPCFSHASWQLGDWCMLPVSSFKGIMDHTVLKDESKFERGFQGSDKDIFVIVKTKSKVTVLWQDGKCSLAVDTQTLLPVGAVNAHEFWPEQLVMEKDISNPQRWGYVRAADGKEQTVKVQWQTRGASEGNHSDRDQMEETVSVYELVEHLDFAFGFSDVVFRLEKNAFGNRAKKDPLLMATQAAAVELSNCDHDTDYLSCIGIVTGFKNGTVEVKWANGTTVEVAPYEICHIDKYEISATNNEENDEGLNQKISECDDISPVKQEKDLVSFSSAGEDCNNYTSEHSLFFSPRAAIGLFTNIASRLFGSGGSTSLPGPVSCVYSHEEESESVNLIPQEDLVAVHPSDLQIMGKKHLEQEEGQENKEPMDFTNPKGVKFRQFDMVNDCSDHHFLGSGKGLAQSQVKRGWLKKVQQEWSVLETELPETIYVRVYEERMDLMRAALVGAPGTPYHDGLFFFDVLLPPDYPHEPPSVHYISGGLRVNPNLYESGKVCLSLLNTWTGTGSEVWNPGNSSILQVLLSLQALVLNEKPYFNEAGYDQQIGRAEGEKNSVSYNENAFLVTCKSMLYLIRRPPTHFGALVEEHFRQRSQNIILACKSYMEGAPLGCASAHETSKGFKIMLGKLFPKLVEAFSASVKH